MDKTFPEEKGHPPSLVNFIVNVYMREKLTPLPDPKALAHALIVSP